jgi:ATP-dependent DNA helicase RecG
MTLSTPLETLTVPDKRLRKALIAGGFLTVGDVLTHYPFRYEDRTAFDGWPDGITEAGPALCLQGVVTDVQLKRAGPGRPFVVVTLAPPGREDTEGLEGLQAFAAPLTLRWFNMPFIAKSFAADQDIIVYGKPKPAKRGGLVIDHPEFEILNDTPTEEATIHLQRIAPIYGAREGVPQKSLRRAVWQLLDQLEDESVPDLLPEPSAQGEFAGQSRAQALRSIHFPPSLPDKDRARRYLALEEFFLLQLKVLRRRQQWDALAGASHCGPGKLLTHWLEALPFPLTGAQQRSIAEIREDLARVRPMNRLLQGDVGSGKTFVAMAAMLLAVESGCQAALMAPTQILAEQHYLNFRRWLDPLGLRIGLRTASRKEDGFDPLFSGGLNRPQILIGTHALLHGDSELPDLGLAVIDEQHKFGVEQRARLVRQGTAPHVLVMTATPIPRTLTMTVYGDLDVSLIDELPAGRRPIVTAVREQPDLAQVASFLKQQFEAGRQAYLVYPLIDESDALDLKAATKEHATWEKKLAPHPVGLLHGRLKPDEKEEVMRRFRANEFAALVSTSVIEVGVDVPNASVMIIFEAERFGLAQLHQLRGRIGRGSHKSFCILATNGKNPEGLQRLQTLAATSDGFAVAEADLLLRGPGDLLGSAQSGIGHLVLGDLVRDTALVRLARRLAAQAIATGDSIPTTGPSDPESPGKGGAKAGFCPA